MRILVFANTPAHVHLYRHAVSRLEERGHEVCILGREYDCTTELLEFYGLPYQPYGAHGTEPTSRLAFGRELIGQLGEGHPDEAGQSCSDPLERVRPQVRPTCCLGRAI